MKVKAIFSFDHDGARRRGDEFEVSDRVGKQLINKGLARLMECVATVPALPAVQAGDMPSAGEDAAVATGLFQDDATPGTGSGRKAKRASAPVEGAEPK